MSIKIIYWNDVYRCLSEDPETWSVDSFISNIQYPDETQETGWFLSTPQTISRVRGPMYVTEATTDQDIEDQKAIWLASVLTVPTNRFSIACGSESSSSESLSSSSESTSDSTSSSSTSESSSSTSYSESSSSSTSESSSSTSESSSSTSESVSSSSSTSESSSSSTSESSSSSTSDSNSSSSSESMSCIPLEITANINGTLSSDTPDPNCFETGEVIVAENLTFTYPAGGGPLVAIVFDSAYPKLACLTDGVSRLTLVGTFNGATATRYCTYNALVSSSVYGGKVTFLNDIILDVDCTDIDTISLYLEEC